MATQFIPTDIAYDFAGPVAFRQGPTGITRTGLAQESQSRFQIPLADLRLSTAFQTPLPGTSAGSDFGITTGTWGTGVPYASCGDCRNVTILRYFAFEFLLPYNYVGGQTVTIMANAGYLTTLPNGAATLVFEVYKSGRNTLISGVNLVTTSAMSIKDLIAGTFGERKFNVTGTGLSPGDTIFVRAALSSVDGQAAVAVIPAISDIAMLCDTKG